VSQEELYSVSDLLGTTRSYATQQQQIQPVSTTPYQEFYKQFQYQGRPAFRIDTSTKRLNLPALSDIPNPIDVTEDGLLIGFTVAVNDPNIRVTCTIYGEGGSSTTLNDVTMREVTFLGRGMNLGVAESVSPQGVSLDPACVKEDIWPYIARYKFTYSLGHQTDDYNSIKGTEFDKWIVLAYSPSIKEAYNRLYLTITNPNQNDQLMHVFQVSRIKFANDPRFTSYGGSQETAARLDFGDTSLG